MNNDIKIKPLMELLEDLDLNALVYRLRKQGLLKEDIPLNKTKALLRGCSNELNDFTSSNKLTHTLVQQ